MPLPPNFLDELRARTAMPVLVGRSVRLLRAGKEHKACCPFHSEKTPSFYVYDDRFHCFGCGENGDAISFVMKSQGLSFMESVQRLADEAGLEVPKSSPAEAEREARRASLQDVLAAAGRIYEAWLFGPEGAAGLEYLRKRGLSDATIKKFGLGWSGQGRGALAAQLKRQNIGTEQLIEAGLMKQGDYGPVDMFFSRVMFPIQDRRGAVLSFSGRILDDGQPKYVNGPETAVFSKRRSLFGVNFAREAVRKGEAAIIVEGQMDVISLAQAGFGGAVAPLGTALTEEQLTEIWRLAPEPVICFDADAAGRRAALRAIELALNSLAPDRSLKFLRLPDKQDPDSLILAQGPGAFAAQLASAQPLSAVLYDLLAEAANRETPEGRAAFHKRLLEIAARITDKSLASEYRRVLLDRFFGERRSARALGGNFTRGDPARFAASRPAQKLARPQIDPAGTDAIRGRILTAIFIAHPALLPDVEEAYALTDLPADCTRLRSAFSAFIDRHQTLDSEKLLMHLNASGLSDEASQVLSLLPASAAAGTSMAEVACCWWHFFGLMTGSLNRLREQCDEVHRDYLKNPADQEISRKHIRLILAVRNAEKGDHDAET